MSAAAVVAALVGTYLLGALWARTRGARARDAYPSPTAAVREMHALAAAHPDVCRVHEIGRSGEGRAIHAYELRCGPDAPGRPRLLVSAQIHAVEFVGSYVARALARHLLEAREGDAEVRALLEEAAVWIVPLLNPDGAARIWRNEGWSRLGPARFTAADVDPNRNFPFEVAGDAPGARRAWNQARAVPGSAYYRGPFPLSEPECLALARLAKRERFCAAVNFHSFGAVVFSPQPGGSDAEKARRVIAAFDGPFQARQPHRGYRPVPERRAATVAQLDPFLLAAFGTPSVTVEVSRPGLEQLLPTRALHVFAWANPARPAHWAENDAPAAAHALHEMWRRSGGTPCRPSAPELADQVPDLGRGAEPGSPRPAAAAS